MHMLELEVGGYLLTAILAGLATVLVIEWWRFRAVARR